ncbi:MAG: hypothetical protein EOO45_29375 [Flavobacterium sp.]|nr:MAG: hypothetical protein EOO45_29375 [Flavobacterium sp.]
MRTILLVALALLMFTAKAFAQEVKTFTIDGKTYYGTKAIPQEITGVYQYEKTKEPIVDIRQDGSGFFQTHDVPKYPVEYWIETDARGIVQKKKSETNSNYQVVLILLYGDNGEAGWKGANKGKYDRIDVVMAFDRGYGIVMGERYRKL